MGSFEKLIYLNNELFTMIEDSISIDLLARLLSTQLITRGEKSLLDRNRLYYRLLRQIISEGQERGELRSDVSAGEIVKFMRSASAPSFTIGAYRAANTLCAAIRRGCFRCCWRIFGCKPGRNV